jgi:hypothetical protein
VTYRKDSFERALMRDKTVSVALNTGHADDSR